MSKLGHSGVSCGIFYDSAIIAMPFRHFRDGLGSRDSSGSDFGV